MSSSDILGKSEKSNTTKSKEKTGADKIAAAASDKKAGRPETPDDKKSEKTIQNKESMN
jgi:hypothetical protein